MGESGKAHKFNVQDVIIMYPLNELIKYLSDEKAFGHAAKYHAHLKYLRTCTGH